MAAPDLDSMSDAETTIDSYIEKSPITTKFRIDNPNLHPMSTEALDTETESEEVSGASHAKTLPSHAESLERQTTLTSTSTSHLRNKMKRLSLARFNTKSDDGKKRLSLHRLSSSSSLRTSVSLYRAPQSVHSLSPAPEDTTTPFWKYHILKFGKNLYLTTNPSLKHIYCRNGPGYYVEVSFNKENRRKDGFTLTFRDIDSVPTNAEDYTSDTRPIMMIQRKSDTEGGYYTVSIARQSKLHHNVIKYVHKNEPSQAPAFNGLSIPKKLDSKYIPLDQLTGSRRFEEIDRFRNYEFKDFNNVKWNVGSIPRVRASKMNRLKNRIRNRAEEQDEDVLKFMGKKNIYFHQNYIEDVAPLDYRVASKNPKDVYLEGENTSFPPVLAMFRPYETKTRKKIINSFNRHLSIYAQPTSEQQAASSEPSGSLKINHKSLDHDIGAGAEIRNYFKGGDGLYYQTAPIDDTPDENKLGWISVYEDAKVFSSRGMFDIVVGLTLAIGFESSLE